MALTGAIVEVPSIAFAVTGHNWLSTGLGFIGLGLIGFAVLWERSGIAPRR